MRLMKTFSVPELLRTHTTNCNQSELTRLLKVNRNTIRKFKNDVHNINHVIVMIEGKFHFYTKTRGLNKC